MKNKFITIFLALSLIIVSLTVVGINRDIPQKTLAVETTADTPPSSNDFKNYESNIPNVWYDQNAFFGIDRNGLSCESAYYIDFISTAQDRNYANDKILTVEMGTPLEFYLEIGSDFASPNTISSGFNYKISNHSSVFNLNISLNYNQADYTLYDNSTPSQDLDFSGSLAGANKPFNLEYDALTSSYVYETLTLNDAYRLMKFTITPNTVGADIFSIHYGENQVKNVFVNVVDVNGDGEILSTNGQIETNVTLSNDIYSGKYSASVYEGDLKNKSISLHKDFLYEISMQERPLTSLYNDYYANFSNIVCRLSSIKTTNKAQITKPTINSFYLSLQTLGEHKIDAKSVIEVDYIDYNSLKQTEIIEFDFDLYVYSYDKTSFIPQNYVEIDEYGFYLYPTERNIDFYIPFIKDENNWTTNLTLNGKSITNFEEGFYSDERTFEVLGQISDNYLQAFLDSASEQFLVSATNIYSYSLSGTPEEIESQKNVYKESQRQILQDNFKQTYGINPEINYKSKTKDYGVLLEKPTLEVNENILDNEITIDLSKSSSVTTFAINNYEKLADKSIITMTSNYPNASLTAGVLQIQDNLKVSSTEITLTCDYGIYGKISNTYKLNFIDGDITYSLSQNVATLNVNERLFIDVFVENNFNNYINESKIEYLFATQNDNVVAEVFDFSNLVISVNAVNEGVDTLTVIAKHENATLFIETVRITVTNVNETATDTRVNFVQGNDIQIYLSSLSNTVDLQVDSPVPPLSDGFNWITFNNSVLQIDNLSPSSARLTALREGSTTVVAISELSDGKSVYALATVTVVSKLPKIDITFTKQDATAFNIYDNVAISVDTCGFSFSNSYSTVWTVDGETVNAALSSDGDEVDISSNALSFYKKFGAGFHTIKVEITDNIYEFTISCEKQINILEVSNKKRELSFADNELNLVYTASKNDIYNTYVLLDGVLSNEFEYKWISNDANVLKIMSNGANVSIEPLKKGSATISVYCNLGSSENENYIHQSLQVNVDEIEKIAFISQNAYPKPGENLTINVEINGKSGYKNLSLPLTVTQNGAPCEYKFENGQIVIENLQSGNLSISTTFGEQTSNISLNVTNFNIKKVLTIALPYLVVLSLIACVILIILKTKNNPYKSIGKKIDKLSERINLAIETVSKNKDKSVVLKEYNAILKAINRLIAQFSYHYDEGRDECKVPLTHTLSIKKILVALINTSDKNYQKADKILTTISEKNIVELQKMYQEILTSLEIYEQNIAKQNEQDIIESKQKKANKTLDNQHEDQLSLLKSQGFIDDIDD